MASEKITEVDVQSETEAPDDISQAEIAWAEDLISGFKPEGIDVSDNGESVDEPDPVAEPGTDITDEPDATAIKPETISEADYARNVAIKAPDGSVSYKTVKQLVDGGMKEADYTRGKQDLARQREQLEEDRGILNLLNQDKHARDYLVKRLDDIKAGKPMEAGDDIEISEEELAQFPSLSKFKDILMKHDVEISKSRTNREQTQADQTVGKINTVMNAAKTAIEKETGLKLEPGVFRARVGQNIIASLDDSVPEGSKISIVGQMILADKEYFLSKARKSYQQEIDLAREKIIDAAKQERSQKAQKPKTLKGGGAAAPAGELADFKMVKDKEGRPDMEVFLNDAFTKGGKRP